MTTFLSICAGILILFAWGTAVAFCSYRTGLKIGRVQGRKTRPVRG